MSLLLYGLRIRVMQVELNVLTDGLIFRIR